MRKVFENIAETIKEFIARRDDLALVVGCAEAENTAILQIVETVEDGSSSELFWIFPDEFSNHSDYATSVLNTFKSKHELIQLLQEKEGLTQWPPIPDFILSESTPPVTRMRELMMFARSLVPTLEGGLLVWGLMPLQIADANEYASWVREVLEHEFPFPWCHHMRIIVRDDLANPVLGAALSDMRHISFYQPDLSPQAIEQALDEEMADENLPLDERLQSVLITAAMDYSHKRYHQAMQKYQLVFRYFSSVKNPTMTALALNGLGEVHRELGQRGEAATCFEAAVVSCTEQEPLPVPVLLNAVMNLGDARMESQQWEDAEGYYNEAQKLATIQRNPEVKMMAIEKLGQAQYEQRKISEAVSSWTAGATLAGKLEQPGLRMSMLKRMQKHYARAGDRKKELEIQRQLEEDGQQS